MSGMFPEVVEATREEGIAIAASYLRRALAEIEARDYGHAAVWIHDALVWMGADTSATSERIES